MSGDPGPGPSEEAPRVERRKSHGFRDSALILALALAAFAIGLGLFNGVVMPRLIHGTGEVQVPDLTNLTLDQAERLRLYQQAERIIVGDCPWVILENRINCILMRPNVRGVKEQLTALDVGTGLSQVDFGFVDLGE